MMSAVFLVVIAFGNLCQTGSAAAAAASQHLRVNLSAASALGAIREAYTTNAICAKKNCINPVFPGLEDLHRLSGSKWICSSLQKASSSMGFCKNAISYDPALPLPSGGGSSVRALVERQDNAASTMFYYHVTGLGLEAWDYQKPEFADDCIKSIWRMVCYTYFPRSEIGCQDGALSDYVRPCQSSCFNYIRSCGVECCDESVQCVFTHTKVISKSEVLTTEGYSPHDGPSSMCTGAAERSAKLSSIFWVVVMIAMAFSLQGCDYDVPMHKVGNWRAEQDYLITHEFIPPGSSARAAMQNGGALNSCSVTRLSQTLQCSGRGVCKLWDPDNIQNTLSFCECDRDWTDPECRTRRKSQTVAYLLSMFFGFLGADLFYLGFFWMGLAKLFTLGGCGAWWVYDIIRIGSAPVYASTYRVADDLPHSAFVLTAVMAAGFVGFATAYSLTVSFRSAKRRDAMMLQAEEEGRQTKKMDLFADAYTTGVKKEGLLNQRFSQPAIQKEGGGPFAEGGANGDGYGSMDNGVPPMPPPLASQQMNGPAMPPQSMPPMGGPSTMPMMPPTMEGMGRSLPPGSMMGPPAGMDRSMPPGSMMGPPPSVSMMGGGGNPFGSAMSMNRGPP